MIHSQLAEDHGDRIVRQGFRVDAFESPSAVKVAVDVVAVGEANFEGSEVPGTTL
jgi:hypothetical protein